MANGRRNAVSKDRPAPIRTVAELDSAIQEIDSLLDQGDALSDSDHQRLESLSDLVRRYESTHYPAPKLSGRDVLRHLLDANEITARQCAAEAGVAHSCVSAFLAGRRELTRREAEKIASRFRLDPSAFGDEFAGGPEIGA